MTPWYQRRWFYVERPFPWAMVLLVLLLVGCFGFAFGTVAWLVAR